MLSGNHLDNNLTELMVMQQQQQTATDIVRHEYIEEPSFRRSMFKEAYVNVGEIKHQEISP